MSFVSRLMVFSPQDNFLFEFSKNTLLNAVQTEEINGEHRLTLLTSAHLEKEQRILTQDATLKWREYVVMGGDGQHEGSERPFNTYNCVWSIQHDFRLFKVDDVVGLDYPVSAAYALDRIMVETDRWSRGTVDLDVLSGADMTQTNGWNALQSLIANWGGELDVTIEVDATKIVSRKVDLYEAMGNQSATRRFDYARDMSSVRRKVDEEPVACRIRPYGKGERTIDDIDVKITIEEVNDGKDYLQNDAMAEYMKLPNGSGGWEYPTIEVANTSIEDEEELLEWGLSVLDEYTTPKVTYETTVMQLVSAGTDAMGIELGDRVQCVDRDFDSNGGVRIENRVKKIEIDLLDSSKTKLTLGNANQSYVNTLNEIIAHVNSDIKELDEAASTTADFLNNLLDNLNAQINATGGYVYVTDGQGIRTYDKRVSNPLVGAEADAVVEIKGGTIRIANSKTATGEWEWKSVFTSGYIAAELVTAAHLTAGYIGSSGDTYIDLDNHTVQLGQTSGPHVVVNSSGMQIYNGSTSLGFFGYESNVGIVRVGQASQGNVVMSGDGYVDIRYGSNVTAHFGYGSGASASGTSMAPYFTLGSRQQFVGTTPGNYSMSVGVVNQANGYAAFAFGSGAQANGNYSMAFGDGTNGSAKASSDHSCAINGIATGKKSFAFSGTASGLRSVAMHGYATEQNSIAIGYNSYASEAYCTAIGYGATAGTAAYQVAIGYNRTLESSVAIGFGIHSSSTSGQNATAMKLYNGSGALWILGNYSSASDRRIKKHHAYLGEDACEFVRALKPVLYSFGGGRHIGFYAQDVADAEPDGWDTETVTEQGMDEDLGYAPLSLDYQALIAPLVAYAQSLEKRIDQQQKQIDEQGELIRRLTERLDKLEA